MIRTVFSAITIKLIRELIIDRYQLVVNAWMVFTLAIDCHVSMEAHVYTLR